MGRQPDLRELVWFCGAVIGHDLLLMPLYSLADRSAVAALRHRGEPQLPTAPWINYLRVPAALSGLLLLVWFPLILRLRSPYHASTTLSADPYLWHWLAVTGTLFLLSAVAFALRLRGQSRTTAPQAAREGEGQQPAVQQDLEDQEAERAAGELARPDDEADDDQSGTSSGQERRAAEEPVTPSPVRSQAGGQHEPRAGDGAGQAIQAPDGNE